MSLSRVQKIALSALEMQRARMELISSNLANSRTTRTASGGPYIRKQPVIATAPVAAAGRGSDASSRHALGVQVIDVIDDSRPPVLRFEPGHPDADAAGYVAYPNVDPVEEMVDMVAAVRSYEANVNVVKTARMMNESALEMIR